MTSEPGKPKARGRLRDNDMFWMFVVFSLMGVFVLLLHIAFHAGYHETFELQAGVEQEQDLYERRVDYMFRFENSSQGGPVLIIDRDAYHDSHAEFPIEEGSQFRYRQWRVSVLELSEERALIEVRYADPI